MDGRQLLEILYGNEKPRKRPRPSSDSQVPRLPDFEDANYGGLCERYAIAAIRLGCTEVLEQFPPPPRARKMAPLGAIEIIGKDWLEEQQKRDDAELLERRQLSSLRMRLDRPAEELASEWVKQMLDGKYSCGLCQVGGNIKAYDGYSHPHGHTHQWEDHVRRYEDSQE